MNWLKSGMAALVDPERKERLQRFVAVLHHELVTQKHEFNVGATAQRAGMTKAEQEEACEELYIRYLENSWKDEEITSAESRSHSFIGAKLGIPASRVATLNWQAGQKVFEGAFSQAMADGVLSDSEFARLDQICAGVGTSLPQLMQGYFRERGEQFLRAMFASMLGDGRLSAHEWHHAVNTAERLGLSKEQLQKCVVPQARLLIEHVLADAKADGVLSAIEEQTFQWLLEEFALPSEFTNYVLSEVQELKVITEAGHGRLPSLTDVRGVELRSSEIPHFQSAGTYLELRKRRGDFVTESHYGVATVTDYRFLFSAATKSFEFSLRKVLEVVWTENGIDLRTSAKGGGTYRFGPSNRLAFAVIRTAVGRANQKIVDVLAGLPTQHIPRDVRQRVWQRYGGRCADCGSDQYLEFDHIVPRARGGSNSDNNVQLLCRGCNLKKSDNI